MAGGYMYRTGLSSVDLANGTLWLRWRIQRGEQHPFLEDLNLSPISYQNDPSRLREFLVKLT